jgi:hypothetical protein
MKVLVMWEIESPEDEEDYKRYLESDKAWSNTVLVMMEGIKYTWLGAWTDRPGFHVSLIMFDSMEEYSKLWSNNDYHVGLNKHKRMCKSLKVRMFKPTGFTLKNPPPIFS